MSVPIVTIFGGSGFIGRQVAQRMARAGWRVRVAVRRPELAGFVRPYGFVGQVEPIQANIRDEASTRAAIVGATAVVNCTGILSQSGKQTFGAVLDEGPARIARLATEAGVESLVHISAIGADPASPSAYAAGKGRGEAAILAAFPAAVILRPSVVFGVGDSFFNKFASMARISPVVPIVGPETRFQPVYVGDVVEAAARAATGVVPAGIYELGGPETVTFREIMARILRIIERRRLLFAIPAAIARIPARILDFVQRITGGLVANTLVTNDQITLLAKDNVVSGKLPGLAEIGIAPTAMEAVLEDYLYVYRPHGQYAEITASARNLRPRT
jgi:NADH dehydrogenase